MKKLILITTILSLFITGCKTTSKVNETITEVEAKERKEIKELQSEIPIYDRIKFYSLEEVTAENEEELLVNERYQQILDKNYELSYFLPWEEEKRFYSKEEAEAVFKSFEDKKMYGENKKEYDSLFLENLKINSELETYPNKNLKGITIRNSNIRLLPTSKPFFEKEDGYPFDELQNSSIHVNTPVFIKHVSKDGRWFLIETAFCAGWIESIDIAYADNAFIEAWFSEKYAVPLKENISIIDDNQNFIFKCNIGSVFPLLNDSEISDEYFLIKTAVADENKNAVIKEIKVKKEIFSTRPYSGSLKNIRNIFSELIETKYGWGGLYENRDCSALLKDLFSTFGIYLSRNSGGQAKDGIFIDISKLKAEDKKEFLLKNGIPFFTLVWMKGHIMLYSGNINGEPTVFHNIWALRSNDKRIVIGKTVITKMDPGEGIEEVTSNIINRIEGITLLVPPINIQKKYNVFFE